MKSFGLWYHKKDNVSDEPLFAVHANFWSESIRTASVKKRTPYLDIGIKIYNYKSVQDLIFQCPFNVEEKQLKDLSEKLENKSNAKLIFNTDCELETKNNYTLIKLDKNDISKDLLIFPMQQSVGNVYDIENKPSSVG